MVSMFSNRRIDFESISNQFISILAGVNDLIQVNCFDGVDGVDVLNFELISNWLFRLV